MKGIPEILVVPLARVRGPTFWLRSAPATSGREARRCPRAVDERAARKASTFTAFGSVGGVIGVRSPQHRKSVCDESYKDKARSFAP